MGLRARCHPVGRHSLHSVRRIHGLRRLGLKKIPDLKCRIFVGIFPKCRFRTWNPFQGAEWLRFTNVKVVPDLESLPPDLDALPFRRSDPKSTIYFSTAVS